MALLTKSKFYYGIEILTDNNIIDFNDGSGAIACAIPIGIYSPQEICNKISSLLTASGSQSYSCTFNRTSRKLTISASSNFTILISSGIHSGSSIYKKLGFTNLSDLSGSNTYTAQSETGYSFEPQFYLLDYIPLEHNIKSVQSSINETGSGNLEIIRYGTKRYMECSMELITNHKFSGDSIWAYNPSGVEDALLFLSYATQKCKIEFMPNKDDVSNYYTLILESTESDQNGIGFKLLEQLEYGVGYYKTGRLIFREVPAWVL